MPTVQGRVLDWGMGVEMIEWLAPSDSSHSQPLVLVTAHY